MTGERDDAATIDRRDLLGAGAAASVGLVGGCLQRVRSLVDRPSPEELSLTVKTPPADEDEPATRITRHLTGHLQAVGIDAEPEVLREEELRRDVLVRGDFELYVARMPVASDPDYLRTLLHSLYVGDPGWQNPFGLTNLDLDEALVAQRSLADDERRERVDDIQQQVARLQPFVPVAIPDEISAVRSDRFEWPSGGLASPMDYLSVSAREPGRADRLAVATTDDLVTKNLNPLAVSYRHRDAVVGLLYEPLGRDLDGHLHPWLAADWTIDDDGAATSVRVKLREGLSWHDGTELTAGDAAFTYRFLQDTTLGDGRTPVPAPRYRDRTSLVESVHRQSDDELRLELGDVAPAVGVRALTVPLLPEHVWRSKSIEAELAGVGVNERVTEALVWANPEPIGSGPLICEQRIDEVALIMRRNDDHFLHRGAARAGSDTDTGPNATATGGGATGDAGGDDAGDDLAAAARQLRSDDVLESYNVAYEELSLRVAPSMNTAVELVAAEEVDATVPSTDPTVATRILEESALDLARGRSPFLYHVGFNTRLDPLGNPYVRRTIARLLDKAFIVEDVFAGYARPAASPLAGTDWLADSLAWAGTDPEVPFVGQSGELDVEGARELFRDIGFQYRDDRLLNR